MLLYVTFSPPWQVVWLGCGSNPTTTYLSSLHLGSFIMCKIHTCRPVSYCQGFQVGVMFPNRGVNLGWKILRRHMRTVWFTGQQRPEFRYHNSCGLTGGFGKACLYFPLLTILWNGNYNDYHRGLVWFSTSWIMLKPVLLLRKYCVDLMFIAVPYLSCHFLSAPSLLLILQYK